MGVLIFNWGTQRGLSAPVKKIPKEIRIGDIVSYTGPYAGFGFNSFGAEAAFQRSLVFSKISKIFLDILDTVCLDVIQIIV
jgi:hypothetical protein